MRLAAVAAVTNDFGLGNGGKLPWHPRRLSLDMSFLTFITVNSYSLAGNEITFKPSDHENYVVMGRNTWESLPPKFRPLKNRRNIVLSSSTQYQVNGDALLANSIQEACEHACASTSPIYILGGSKIYEEVCGLENLEALFLTELVSHSPFPADVCFPAKCLSYFSEKINITEQVFNILKNEIKIDGNHYITTINESTVYVDGDVSYSINLYLKAKSN